MFLVLVPLVAGADPNCTQKHQNSSAAAKCNCTLYCDHVGGVPNTTLAGFRSTTRPNVLLVGDSLSAPVSGYFPSVLQYLSGGNNLDLGLVSGNRSYADLETNAANVHAAVSWARPYPQGSGQCGSSFGIVACSSFWLGEETLDGAGDPKAAKWDVIHWNWGLHDIDHTYSPLIPRDGGAVYLQHMETVYERIQTVLAPGGVLILCTTTPVPRDYKARNNTGACMCAGARLSPHSSSPPPSTLALSLSLSRLSLGRLSLGRLTEVVAVNAAVRTLFGPGGKHPEVVIHDLYAEVVMRCNSPRRLAARGGKRFPEQSEACDIQTNGVHFGDLGRQYTGVLVANAIFPHI